MRTEHNGLATGNTAEDRCSGCSGSGLFRVAFPSQLVVQPQLNVGSLGSCTLTGNIGSDLHIEPIACTCNAIIRRRNAGRKINNLAAFVVAEEVQGCTVTIPTNGVAVGPLSRGLIPHIGYALAYHAVKVYIHIQVGLIKAAAQIIDGTAVGNGNLAADVHIAVVLVQSNGGITLQFISQNLGSTGRNGAAVGSHIILISVCRSIDFLNFAFPSQLVVQPELNMGSLLGCVIFVRCEVDCILDVKPIAGAGDAKIR